MARRSTGPDRCPDRKSTRLNSSHTEIYTLSLHDALPISLKRPSAPRTSGCVTPSCSAITRADGASIDRARSLPRSEEHTSELQSHRDLHSFPTRRSSDLAEAAVGAADERMRHAVVLGDHTGRWRVDRQGQIAA